MVSDELVVVDLEVGEPLLKHGLQVVKKGNVLDLGEFLAVLDSLKVLSADGLLERLLKLFLKDWFLGFLDLLDIVLKGRFLFEVRLR